MFPPPMCYQNGSVVVVKEKKSDKEPLNLRVPSQLKARVVEYASHHGLTYNAAACILLDKGLQTENR